MDAAQYMTRALRLAARARGMTSPNPMVGAVLVKRGRIIGQGYHRKAGGPHAEVIAIDAATETVANATLYVTLEPCCHRDKRTPPCTDKIIASGISRVVIAMLDPNPKVAGRGVEALVRAGIRVESGLLEDQAEVLNEAYIRHTRSGMPFVTLKAAMTLDGRIATPAGESKWITGERARNLVHRLRSSSDAVLTAIGTVRADDPQLTCRTGGRSPRRVLIDPGLSISESARILDLPPETIIVGRPKGAAAAAKAGRLQARGVKMLPFRGSRVDLRWLMAELGSMGILSVLVEGGGSLNASCFDAGIVDKVMFFIAPKIICGAASIPVVGGKTFRALCDAIRIERLRLRRIGDDVLIEGYVGKEISRLTGEIEDDKMECTTEERRR